MKKNADDLGFILAGGLTIASDGLHGRASPLERRWISNNGRRWLTGRGMQGAYNPPLILARGTPCVAVAFRYRTALYWMLYIHDHLRCPSATKHEWNNMICTVDPHLLYWGPNVHAYIDWGSNGYSCHNLSGFFCKLQTLLPVQMV